MEWKKNQTRKVWAAMKKTEGLRDKQFFNFGGWGHSDVKVSNQQKT